MTLRSMIARIGVVGLGLVSLCLGLALGSTACLCDCPETDEIEPGSYVITQSETRPELLGGAVDVQPDLVTFTYASAGIDWTVVYEVDLE